MESEGTGYATVAVSSGQRIGNVQVIRVFSGNTGCRT